MNSNLTKKYIIKDLWEDNYLSNNDEWKFEVLYAKKFDSYEEACEHAIPNSTVIEMFVSNI